MKKAGGKIYLAGLLSICFLVGSSMTSFAANPVSGVNIKITNQYSEGQILEPTIELTTPECEISEIVWSSNIKGWRPGKKVDLTLTIINNTDRIFEDVFNKTNCKVSGADFISAKVRNDNRTLTIKIEYYPVVQLGAPGQAGWSEGSLGMAMWDKVNYATGYQIQVYENDKKTKSLKVGTNTADLTPYIDNGSEYYYEVNAIGLENADRKYMKEGKAIPSDNNVFINMGDTTGAWKKYKEGYKYREEAGNYATNCWKMIRNKWYYFKPDSIMAVGWNFINNHWYYLNPDGAMHTGWLNINDKWYYLNADGSMQVGWTQGEPGKWYYMYGDGSMAANTVIDGYQVDSSGLWIQ